MQSFIFLINKDFLFKTKNFVRSDASSNQYVFETNLPITELNAMHSLSPTSYTPSRPAYTCEDCYKAFIIYVSYSLNISSLFTLPLIKSNGKKQLRLRSLRRPCRIDLP